MSEVRKPDISPRFDVDDIRKIRDYNSQRHSRMTRSEIVNEIRQEFQKTIHEVRHEATLRRVEESEKLIADTIQGHEEAVAAQIEKVHAEETAAIHYNKEDSLRSVIKLASTLTGIIICSLKSCLRGRDLRMLRIFPSRILTGRFF